MSHPFFSVLSPLDRVLLQTALRIVPRDERTDWLRCWQAELWHRRHARAARSHSAADLYPGLVLDAVWLRTESCRQALAGTAFLCLGTLLILTVIAAIPLFALFGDSHRTFTFLLGEVPRLVIEASLTTMVAFAIASRPIEHATPHATSRLIQAHLFQAVKIALLQTLAYLLSLGITEPFHAAHPFTAEFLQPQLFTVLALLALRWSFLDQDARCRHCLRCLAPPARVGRPSWNFLDFNGTHLTCRDGHGLLSIPEMETSWRQSSEWITQ